MSSLSYEVALFGEFFSQDLTGTTIVIFYQMHLATAAIPHFCLRLAIMNRITLHSESARQILTRELVFEPVDTLHQRESGSEPVLLRARKEMLEPNSKW